MVVVENSEGQAGIMQLRPIRARDRAHVWERLHRLDKSMIGERDVAAGNAQVGNRRSPDNR